MGKPPISHPKCWSFLVGKPHGFVGVSPTILGVTPMCWSRHEPMDATSTWIFRGCFEQRFTDGCRSLAGWGEGHNSYVREEIDLQFLHSLSRSLYVYIWVFPKIVGFPPKSSHFNWGFPLFSGVSLFWETPIYIYIYLGGGFKYFWLSFLYGKMIQFD